MPETGKFIVVVLDGVGVGALPDAHHYGDEDANTLAHIAEYVADLTLPQLVQLGLGNIVPLGGIAPAETPTGCFGKMTEISKGKDSTTGHWELAGIITKEEFPRYPHGFPNELLDTFLRETGCEGFLGNKAASGTEIIRELGDDHRHTGFPIVYTSADSVFQIAAHEEVIPVERLYEICMATRHRVAIGKHRVGRVIARPFVGTSGAYVRTPNRRDFAVEPPLPTLLDVLTTFKIPTIGIGKIEDLFCGRGLQKAIHTKSNNEGITYLLEESRVQKEGFIIVNLVDFDMLYGHRQDVVGFATALKEFDNALPEIIATLRDQDILLLTADHGNDPTDASTDHTREYVPLLTYSPKGSHGLSLGTRNTFADVAQTVVSYFDIPAPTHFAGTSFLSTIV